MSRSSGSWLIVCLGKTTVNVEVLTWPDLTWPDLTFLVMFAWLGRMSVEVGAGSVSCRLGGSSACKWSCRLRGFIRGDCQEAAGGGGGTQCSCTQVRAVISQDNWDSHQHIRSQSITASNVLDYFTEKISEKYPDTPLVTDIVNDIITNHNRTCYNSKSDGKWR